VPEDLDDAAVALAALIRGDDAPDRILAAAEGGESKSY
jgi:hypothetical protein